jgi:group I intron endonuclease
MGYIYKITSIIDNKIYIGQTKNSLEDRWRSHLNKNSHCRYLSSAIQKHGVANFKFELVCISFDEKLDEIEKEYIKKFNCLVPNGYNLKEGGNSSKHNEETKQKISQSLKGRKDIIYAKPQLGKPHNEETKQKISNSTKGRKFKLESYIKRCKSVLQLDINNNIINKYVSIREAARINSICFSTISNCCNGKKSTYNGYKWEFEKL